jgi:hypothetical protein
MLQQQLYDRQILMPSRIVVVDREVQRAAYISFGSMMVVEFIGIGAGFQGCAHGGEF